MALDNRIGLPQFGILQGTGKRAAFATHPAALGARHESRGIKTSCLSKRPFPLRIKSGTA
jgi:hypothetical protein